MKEVKRRTCGSDVRPNPKKVSQSSAVERPASSQSVSSPQNAEELPTSPSASSSDEWLGVTVAV